jgi:hypothetical protein
VGAESFLHSRKGVLYTFWLKREDALSYEWMHGTFFSPTYS